MANGVNGKRIPRKQIYQHFIKMPENRRKELLRKHFSPEAIEKLGKKHYTDTMMGLRIQSWEEGLAFLKDSKNAGGPMNKLLPLAEAICSGFMGSAYTGLGPKATDTEKLLTLIRGRDLGDRVKGLWEDGVTPAGKAEYRERALGAINTENNVAFQLENPENYKAGSNLDRFLADIQATMKLNEQKSTMELLRDTVPEHDPRKEEKLRRALQQFTFQAENNVDTAELAQKLRGQDWEERLNPQASLKDPGQRSLQRIVQSSKQCLDDLPDTEEDKQLLREAALQSCQEVKRTMKPRPEWREEQQGIEARVRELQDQVVQYKLKQGAGKQLLTELDGEYAVLMKVKQGRLLSSTNTREHKDMTKALRIFRAKLQLLEGKPLPKDMDPEEARIARESDVNSLYDSARQSCYKYGCLKTKNGKSGIIHEAGELRFKASMKALSQLNQLGNTLRLGQPAALLRDDALRQLLENRRSDSWLRQNAANLAARTIYAQNLLNEGKSWDAQSRLLTEEHLQAQVEKIQKHAGFQQMLKSLGHKGLADTMIQGVTKLALVYEGAFNKARQKGQQRTASEIAPEALGAQQGDAGLTAAR